MISAKNFGKLFYQESIESKLLDKKEMFITLIENYYISYINCLNVKSFGFEIHNFTNSFFIALEYLIYLNFGKLKGDIILWYIYERFDREGNYNPLIIELENKEKQEIIINSSEELWNFLQNIEE